MLAIPKKALIDFQVNGEIWTVLAQFRRHLVVRSPGTTLAYRGQTGVQKRGLRILHGTVGWLPIKSCLTLADEAIGHHVITIEGLKDTLVQKAFLVRWAFQCGYCTSGFIVVCHALAQSHPNAGDKIIEEWLQSDLCRCTSYKEIQAAVKSAISR